MPHVWVIAATGVGVHDERMGSVKCHSTLESRRIRPIWVVLGCGVWQTEWDENVRF